LLSWAFDGDALHVPDGPLSVSGARDDRLARLRYGTWGLLPILRAGSGQGYAIRLLPGHAVEQSPVVFYAEAEAITVASTLQGSLPAILRHAAIDPADRWTHLHRALGGEGAPLAAPAPDSAEVGYREYVGRCVREYSGHLPLPEGLQGWTAAAAANCFAGAWSADRTARRLGVEPAKSEASRRLLIASWQVQHHPASLDRGFGRMPGLRPRITGSYWQSCADAAQVLCRRERDTDPGWHRHPLWNVVRTIAEAPGEYDGEVHLHAAAALDMAGDIYGAWSALCSGAYWSYVRRGAAREPFFDAARTLSAKHAWRAGMAHTDRLSA
jgi:hypothetical protein